MKKIQIQTLYGNIHIDLSEPDSEGRFSGQIITSFMRGEDYGDVTAAIESLILAHACAGVDVESPAYIAGLETALQAIDNNS